MSKKVAVNGMIVNNNRLYNLMDSIMSWITPDDEDLECLLTDSNDNHDFEYMDDDQWEKIYKYLTKVDYVKVEFFDFGDAVALLKAGEKVARKGWNGKGMWLAYQEPDENSKMSRPYIYMKTVNNELVPWVASQSDILADDWVSIEE